MGFKASQGPSHQELHELEVGVSLLLVLDVGLGADGADPVSDHVLPDLDLKVLTQARLAHPTLTVHQAPQLEHTMYTGVGKVIETNIELCGCYDCSV